MKHSKFFKLIVALKKILKKYMNFICLVISCLVVVYFFTENSNFLNLLNTLPKLNNLWLMTAIFSILISWYVDSLSVYEIIKLIIKKPPPKILSYKITIINQYFSSTTPLGCGSQPMQMMELMKSSIKKADAISIITTKFIFYQSALSIYSIVFGIIYFLTDTFKKTNQLSFLLIIGVIFQTFLVFILTVFLINKHFVIKIENVILDLLHKTKIIKNPRKILKKSKIILENFSKNFLNVFRHKKIMYKLFLYGALQILFVLLVPFFVFKAFHHTAFPIIRIIGSQCIVNTISSFTPLPGNSGTSEKIFLKLFDGLFLKNETSIAMIICRLITFYINIIFGSILYFLIKKSKN